MFRLYIGSDNKTKELKRKQIEEIISKYFEGFTIYEATGYWKGTREKTAVVEIETEQKEKIKDLIKTLKKELKQESIGLVKLAKMLFI